MGSDYVKITNKKLSKEVKTISPTYFLEAELTTNNIGIVGIPKVTTNNAPNLVITKFHSSCVTSVSICQPNRSMVAARNLYSRI